MVSFRNHRNHIVINTGFTLSHWIVETTGV